MLTDALIAKPCASGPVRSRVVRTSMLSPYNAIVYVTLQNLFVDMYGVVTWFLSWFRSQPYLGPRLDAPIFRYCTSHVHPVWRTPSGYTRQGKL